MTDAAPEAAAPEQAPEQPQEGGTPEAQEPPTFDADYVEKLRKEAAKYRTEAKAQAAELEKFRKSSMSEAEKQVAEAETRGRQAATAEFGSRLARSQFDAMAAKRNPQVDTAEIVEFVNMSRFLGDDGEVDTAALQVAVDRLVPAPQAGPPSFDGGARTPPGKSPDMNDLIRRQAGRG